MPSERHTDCELPPVALVGAGPGDPGLITVAGADLLARADVVVFDALANPALLELAPAGAERVDVGKRAGRHSMTQDQINALLVELGRSGRRVVRLKGGDPFVFGRGGEEAEALVDAGLSFVVVPGVTSGVAAAAYAGIPVTHRDFTTSFTVVTGHEDPDKAASKLHVDALAKLDCLAFYMSVGTLARNAAALIAAGKDPRTPAAVIERGTWPSQRTVVAPLSEIAAAADASGIAPPALVIVGPTVSLRDKLNWFERRPLFGATFVVTRTRQQASSLARGLREMGGHVLEAPTIRIQPPEDWAAVDAELGRLASYDWIVFTSANGVCAFARRMRSLGLDARSVGSARLAAVGPATATELDRLFLRADVIPDEFLAQSLARSLGALGDLRAKKFLLLRADIARPALTDALAQAGAQVADCAIYRTGPADALPDGVPQAVAHGAWITFTSASTATNFFALADEPAREALRTGRARAACIGPVVAEEFARLSGRQPDVVANPHTVPGLIAAIGAAASRGPR